MPTEQQPFLFQKLDAIREYGGGASLPPVISDNLNPEFEIRPYQEAAFCNFVTHYESAKRAKPLHVLFHMATGSGKTLIMAGLIAYLYEQGYRNFLFFVNLTNIVDKTRENFLNQASSKYLFAESIIVDGEAVPVRAVENFQGVSNKAINICFTTIQGLHSDLTTLKENAPTPEDFTGDKVVLIADEAHHLNVTTRSRAADEARRSWEDTVSFILNSNVENVLLEFTATADLANRNVKTQYLNKIIFDYPLKKFREDRYSKQIQTIQADLGHADRMLQALMFSQYRLKRFQDHHLNIKPVVLLKSRTISESVGNVTLFRNTVDNLTGAALQKIVETSPLEEVADMARYFAAKGLNFDQLARELRDDFSETHCVSANDDKEATALQVALNTLEDRSNPYRAVFQVKKLDEGWDVLNLFDIVRLYETRDAREGKPGPGTIAEAQLIGRGARYCPFVLEGEPDKYQRKFDNDITHPLRICETLFYHCQFDSRYINELNAALIAIGLEPKEKIDRTYAIKPSFKDESLYESGLVFFNEKVEVSRSTVTEIPERVRSKAYRESVNTGRAAVDTMMDNSLHGAQTTTQTYPTTIGKVAADNYSLVHRAIRRVDALRFDLLRQRFPNLRSTRQLLTDPNYLGGIRVEVVSRDKVPTAAALETAMRRVLSKIGEAISGIEVAYQGSETFKHRKFRDVFRDKTIHVADPKPEGLGTSQSASTVRDDWRIDLSDKDWFVFNDNYGTSEEKAFVAYFSKYVDDLRRDWDTVYLVRNERQLVLYSFDTGERFEPDYLMILGRDSDQSTVQYQLFVEPKGGHLLTQDEWKEAFLAELEQRGVVGEVLADDTEYRVIGLPFFNVEHRSTEFAEAFAEWMPSIDLTYPLKTVNVDVPLPRHATESA